MDEITKERIELAAAYDEGIKNPLFIKPEIAEGSTHVWHQYVLRVPEYRDRLREYLEEKGITTIIHYPISPHLSQAYEYLGVNRGQLPVTEQFANEVVSLPIYTGMRTEEQKCVIDALNEFSV